jgi:hypothetical protein
MSSQTVARQGGRRSGEDGPRGDAGRDSVSPSRTPSRDRRAAAWPRRRTGAAGSALRRRARPRAAPAAASDRAASARAARRCREAGASGACGRASSVPRSFRAELRVGMGLAMKRGERDARASARLCFKGAGRLAPRAVLVRLVLQAAVRSDTARRRLLWQAPMQPHCARLVVAERRRDRDDPRAFRLAHRQASKRTPEPWTTESTSRDRLPSASRFR